jgi:hypothetical protein
MADSVNGKSQYKWMGHKMKRCGIEGGLRIADWEDGREKAQKAQEGKFRFVHLVLFCG